MRLSVRAVFFASFLVSAISFAVCALFVAAAPEATSRFFSFVFHIDLASLARHITWGSFAGGIVCFSFGIALHFGAAAWLYNRVFRALAVPYFN
ncbi:MAG TPA: DUF5676 family membrane protein [Thermoanaerobaculia bacterium]|nr:DUF5676 family membrane protein [Thermoanaerobaculia bacterium]